MHDRPVERAEAGQRVAVALPGVERGELRRGDAFVEPDAYPLSYRLDVVAGRAGADARRRAPARPPRHRRASALELVRVGERHAQLRLGAPVVAARGDRLVLREGTTLGGGAVLDPAPPRRPSAERLELLERGDPASIVLGVALGGRGAVRREELAHRALLAPDELDAGLTAAVRAGDWYLDAERLEELQLGVVRALDQRAARIPARPGNSRWPSCCRSARGPRPSLPLLPVERRGAKAYAPGATSARWASGPRPPTGSRTSWRRPARRR